MVFIGFYDVLEVFLNENGLEKKKFRERKIHYTLFFGYHIGDLILGKASDILPT
jgi:hypothetical protein